MCFSGILLPPKGYLCLDGHVNHLIISGHLVFEESSFPFFFLMRIIFPHERHLIKKSLVDLGRVCSVTVFATKPCTAPGALDSPPLLGLCQPLVPSSVPVLRRWASFNACWAAVVFASQSQATVCGPCTDFHHDALVPRPTRLVLNA